MALPEHILKSLKEAEARNLKGDFSSSDEDDDDYDEDEDDNDFEMRGQSSESEDGEEFAS